VSSLPALTRLDLRHCWKVTAGGGQALRSTTARCRRAPPSPPPVHGVRRRTADGRMGWAAPRSAERLVLDVYSPNNEFSRRGPDPIQFSIGGAATGCGQHTTGGTIGGGWRDHASARGSAGAV
jgi:hypothetical protein